MTVRLVWRPITRWPREQTTERTSSPFRTAYDAGTYRRGEVPWSRTELDLDRELRALNVDEAVVQVAITERDVRLDGQIRADARPTHPGVILTFAAPGKGPLTFACDKWTTWQANIRGITKGLEALRVLERYGITTTGEQYTGWKELASGVPMSERADLEDMSVQEAARIVVGWVSGAHDLNTNAQMAIEDEDYRRFARRQAVKHLHPDAGGTDTDAFLRLERAMKILEQSDE